MPLILSQERTVGIEVTLEKPVIEKYKRNGGTAINKFEYDSQRYLSHLSDAPRLPILGTVPDHWKEGR